MNFESIKIGFLNYLEEKSKDVNEKPIENTEISIFLYSDEFKDYLVQEVGADVSIFSKSINEIMSMDIVNGKLVENKDENSDSFEKEDDKPEQNNTPVGTIPAPVEGGEGAGTVQTGNDATQVEQSAGTTVDGAETGEDVDENSMMTSALNDIFSNEKVINTLDVDQNGELNEEEINAFLSGIANPENNGNITYDDLAQAVQSIQNGTFEIPAVSTESGNNVINRLLDKVYANKTVIKTLDLDGDGELNDAEKAKFEEFIKGYSDDGDELTEADIKRAFDEIMEGSFSYDTDLEEKSEEIDIEVEEEMQERAQAAEAESNPQGTQTVSPSTSGVSGVSSPRGTTASANSFSNSNAVSEKTIDNMTLEELQSEKTTKEADIKEAEEGVKEVYSGDNEAVKAAQEEYEAAEETYDEVFEKAFEEALEENEDLEKDLDKQREENLDAISAKENEINDINMQITDQESAVSDQEAVVSADESNLAALKSSLSALKGQTSDDETVQAEINAKISQLNAEIAEAETKLNNDKEKLNELKDGLNTLKNETLKTAEEELNELEEKRSEIEEKIKTQVMNFCSEEVKQQLQEAMDNFNEAKENVNTVKEEQAAAARQNLEEVKSTEPTLEQINEKINEKKAEETKKEYSVSEYDFDFELNLSDSQKSALEKFKSNWEENKEKYEEVEEATGMPDELIAAIHWRESGGNFDTYLHNGQKLGTVTTIVPKGVYFEDWTEAAIDAVTNYGGNIANIEEGNLDTYYEYAERYNGLGYRNKGLPSPYVWAGTDNYSKGKYVADGQFDPNAVDQQLGVAVMLRALLE